MSGSIKNLMYNYDHLDKCRKIREYYGDGGRPVNRSEIYQKKIHGEQISCILDSVPFVHQLQVTREDQKKSYYFTSISNIDSDGVVTLKFPFSNDKQVQLPRFPRDKDAGKEKI